jgi:hypothetical protein
MAANGHERVPPWAWWADPSARYVPVYYAAREVREIFFTHP